MKNKKILILDIDGIFTNGLHFYTKDWKLLKAFWSNDRFLIKKIIEKNIFENIFCLTWDKTWNWIDISKRRIEKEIWLKLVSIKLEGYDSKIKYLKDVFWEEKLKNDIIYVWDDIADIPVIKKCFFSATVTNAPKLVKKYVNYISDYKWWEWWLTDILCYLLEYLWYDIEKILDIN